MGYGSTIKVPFGPQHPALKEPESFIFEIDGDIVVDVKPRIGYNHRGVEKAFEIRTYLQNIYLAERVCGICSDAHVTAYTQAVEELLEIEAPPRAKYIRTIIAELERIHSHSLWIGVAAHEIGFDTLFMYLWRDREAAQHTGSAAPAAECAAAANRAASTSFISSKPSTKTDSCMLRKGPL
jgi:NADH-quinone oxidoreductase subunit D